jgi:MFS family permease
MLSLAQVVSFLDRSILSLLIVPIKADLGLSDTQLGLLHGLGFAILYCLLGVPIGRLVDTGNRRRLIVIGVAFWSAMTALCGLARGFATLFAARVGVGLGETVLIPAAASMLSTTFPPRQLGRAMSIFGMGAYLGNGLAFMGGAALLSAIAGMPSIANLQPWRVAFIMAAVPGVIVIVLMLLTTREPARLPRPDGSNGSFGEAIVQLRAHRFAYAAHFVTSCCVSMMANASNAWIPTALVRHHGISVPESGLIFGAVVLGSGALGILCGGVIADRLWAKGRRDGYQRMFAIACLAALLPGVFFPLMTSLPAAIGLLALFYFLAIMPISATIAALQLMTPAPMRGLITALFLAGSTLVGFGIGPAFVAVMSDYLYGGGPIALSWALSTMVAVAAPIGAFAAWINRKHFVSTALAAGSIPATT